MLILGIIVVLVVTYILQKKAAEKKAAEKKAAEKAAEKAAAKKAAAEKRKRDFIGKIVWQYRAYSDESFEYYNEGRTGVWKELSSELGYGERELKDRIMERAKQIHMSDVDPLQVAIEKMVFVGEIEIPPKEEGC